MWEIIKSFYLWWWADFIDWHHGTMFVAVRFDDMSKNSFTVYHWWYNDSLEEVSNEYMIMKHWTTTPTHIAEAIFPTLFRSLQYTTW